MGYLSWGSSKPSKKGGARKPATPPPSTVAAAAAASGGCMNAVLHMFDFQRFQLCLHTQLDHHDTTSFSLDHHPTPLKGVEAPRNSLEIQKIPEGIEEIKTKRRDTKLKVVEPRAESMDSPRTPGLVARLMGLDILPESSSSTPRLSKTETPRRLSLQINKENSIVREIESSRPSCSAINTKRKEGNLEDATESRSPGYYARQVMKQVRESVSRRVGADITNTIHRRDQHLLTSSSPSTKNRKPSSKASILNSEALQIQKKQKKTPPKSLDLIRNKKEENFVRPPILTNKKKCKKTPLSSELLHLNKDSSKLLYKQGSSSSKASKPIICMNPSKEKELQYISRILKCSGIERDTPVSLARWFSSSHPLDPSIFQKLENTHYADEPFMSRKLIFDLVDGILADLLKPYIKLPRRSIWMCGSHDDQHQIYGFQLVKLLCSRVRSFPSAHCQILQDIDALVEKDLPNTRLHTDVIALEEEGDAIVSEIQRNILDSLIHEIAVICLAMDSNRGFHYKIRYKTFG